MVYLDYKVYGPYTAKDGRMRVVLCHPSKDMKTISYPKFLIERKLGRYLDREETIHHIDGNPRNNDFSNLKILCRHDHAVQDVIRRKEEHFVCPICKRKFTLVGTALKDATFRKVAGPFCSKHCAGVYGAAVQNGRTRKLGIRKIGVRYHKLSEPSIRNDRSERS